MELVQDVTGETGAVVYNGEQVEDVAGSSDARQSLGRDRIVDAIFGRDGRCSA
jgi:hypothetical protein